MYAHRKTLGYTKSNQIEPMEEMVCSDSLRLKYLLMYFMLKNFNAFNVFENMHSNVKL